MTHDRGWWIAFALCVLSFFVHGWVDFANDRTPFARDEDSYLNFAHQFKDEGALCDGSRMPLWPILLSPIADQSWDYVIKARFMVFMSGVLSLVWLSLTIKKFFGAPMALAFAFLFSGGLHLRTLCGIAVAEHLLILFMGLGWIYLIQFVRSGKYFWPMILSFFLAHMSKGTFPLFLQCLILMTVIFKWKSPQARCLRWWDLGKIMVLIFVMSLPVALDNQERFGSMFHNDSRNALWLDYWDPNTKEVGSFLSYMQSHSLFDVVERLVQGSVDTLPYFIGMFGFYIHQPVFWKWFYVLLLVILILCPSWRRRLREAWQANPFLVAFSCFFVTAHFLAFAFLSPSGVGTRYYAAQVPMVLFALAWLLCQAFKARWVTPSLGVLSLLSIFYLLSHASNRERLRWPLEAFKSNPRVQAFEWLEQKIADEGLENPQVAIVPDKILPLAWRFSPSFKVFPYRGGGGLADYLEERAVDVAIFTLRGVRSNPDFYKEYLMASADSSQLQLIKTPEGYSLDPQNKWPYKILWRNH